jgi:hypothetical protein
MSDIYLIGHSKNNISIFNVVCVIWRNRYIFKMRNTGRIPSSDGNLIIFENLDIPIAIEVPRFPPPIICTFISIFYFWFFFFFSFSQ